MGLGTGGEAPTARTRVRRVPRRGVYDRAAIDAILDDALVCHVGFVSDGFPHVIPMAIARNGDELLLHGSSAGRLTRVLEGGADVCVTVTHLDGVIVSRSVFDSSMNYRSVVVFGRVRSLTDRDERLDALRVLAEHLIPGRWDEARRPNDQELKATTVLALAVDEASAKIRSGPPQDDETDIAGVPRWAGEIPVRMVSLAPIPDAHVPDEVPVPASVGRFRERRIRAIEAPGNDVGSIEIEPAGSARERDPSEGRG